jgi:biopolymer transport protein ExbB
LAFGRPVGGGAASHEIVVGAAPAAYIATFEPPPVPPDWWDGNWRRRLRLSLDTGAVTQSLVDFPVLVTLDSSRISYGNAQANGQDLRCVASDSSTILAHEIEEWNPAGTSRVWVRLPNVPAGGAPAHFWVYYGNPSAGDAQNRTAVWSSGYAAVWHLHTSLQDSSANGNHAANSGSTDSAGSISGGESFDGVNDSLNAGAGASLNITGSLTVAAPRSSSANAPPPATATSEATSTRSASPTSRAAPLGSPPSTAP